MSEKAGDPINPADFLGAVASYYSSSDGKLVSMPFNSSTPVFYYNKDAFKKAGLDAEKPPKTWKEVAEAGKKLRAAGMECGYTRSEEHTSELQSLMRISYAVFCLKKKKKKRQARHAPNNLHSN